MKKNRQNQVSEKTQQEAMAVAKATQRPGQTKEQTRLIAQGIQKGIAEYKKGVKNKQRQADKEKKRQQRLKQGATEQENKEIELEVDQTSKNKAFLPWTLLVISWAGFIAYYLTNTL